MTEYKLGIIFLYHFISIPSAFCITQEKMNDVMRNSILEVLLTLILCLTLLSMESFADDLIEKYRDLNYIF